MASVYERDHSRFWWIKYRDPNTGKIVRASTGIDKSLPSARRLAKRKEAEWTQKEMAAPRTRETERWEAWADQFFRARYRNPKTLANARKGLLDCLAFFREHGIRTPRMVNYEVANGFIPWRVSGKTLAPVAHNTAALRFVFFSVLMAEAVRRRFAEFNHCLSVEVHREPARKKKEISIEDQKRIEAELLTRPEWMRDQWLILMHQGCRIAETDIPLSCIDTKAMTITLRIKGGKDHTASLHPVLLPLVAKAKAANRERLLDALPVGSWSPTWSQLFKKLRLPYSIHCTRVTVITRLVRAGHAVPEICNFIGHSEAVNKIYRQLKPADSLGLLATLAGSPIRDRDSRKKRNRDARPAKPARAARSSS